MRRFFERLEDRRLLAAIMGVLGNSANIADGDTTPATADFTDFGHIDVTSGQVTRLYTIKNTGDAVLNLSPVQIGGANAGEFSVLTAPPATVAAGASATFVIKWDPSAAGTRAATITIPHADSAANPYNFSIQGAALNMTTSSTGLQTATTVAGSGRVSVTGDTLEVNYTGYLLDGLKFDSSLNPGRTPFQFKLGAHGVIDGWEEGMLGMKVGEHRVLVVPPSLGYGAAGQGNVPPNATMVFEVDLLSFVAPDMKIRGGGQVIADGDTTPSVIDGTSFGTISIGTKQTHTFSITNDGSAGLNFTDSPAVKLTGVSNSAFTVTDVSISGTTATFTVTFQPTTLGSATATVSIGSNDPNHNPYDFKVSGTAAKAFTESVGIMRGNGNFLLDTNANHSPDAGDVLKAFGAGGDKPVAGDWTGNGVKRIGVFRGNLFILDINGDGNFGAGDATYPFGISGDTPVVGDWNGDGTDDIGVWRDGIFYLDTNGSHDWNGPTTDQKVTFGGTTDKPVIGDWNGDGIDDVGTFKASGASGSWLLDSNGSRAQDAADATFLFGLNTDYPTSGDYNGDGKTEVGVYRSGKFIIDLNNDHAFNASNDLQFNFGESGSIPIAGMWTKVIPQSVGTFANGQFIADTDRSYSYTGAADKVSSFGQAGDKPVIGDWNGDGKLKVGIFRNGAFTLDSNGNGTYEGTDQTINFGQPGDKPVVGDWDGDGKTDVGVFRNGNFLLRIAGATVAVNVGIKGQPVAGDWNGDGKTDLGIRIGNVFFLDANGNRKWDGPNGGDVQATFGNLTGDKPVIGDWNGDGISDIGVFRSGQFILDSNGDRQQSVADLLFNYGQPTDQPFVIG